MNNPLISIIIPVYNGSDYLDEAIMSALNQTYKNIEVIVVNDGSNDEGKSEAIALKFQDRIQYIHKKNGGVSTAFNEGIKNMKGEYFSWLSHDDVYYPNKIQEQINFLNINGLINKEAILYSDYDIINEKSNFVNSRKITHDSPAYFRWLMLTSYPLNGNTVLIPKTCFEKVGLFNEEYKTQQDYDMWVRLSLYYSFYHIPKSLIQSRVHSQQGTVTMSKLMVKNNGEFYVSFLASIGSNELLQLSKQKSRAFAYRILAKNQASRKNIVETNYCCCKYRENVNSLKYISYYQLLFQCQIILKYRIFRTFMKKLLQYLIKKYN